MQQPQVVELNAFQAAVSYAARAGIKTIDAECGRGTGKSFELADIIQLCARGLPRGKMALSGPSYRSMLSDTLPSTVEALEKMHIYKGIHYFIGNDNAPKKMRWPEPFQPPHDWTNYIRFWTGFAIGLVSQDRSTVEHRGHNWDVEAGDERASLDPVRLFNEVTAGNRTRRPQFEDCPLFHGAYYFGSTPMTREGQEWLKGEVAARENPGKALWIRANAWQVNRHNLAEDWFEKAKRKALSEMHYNAEVLNIRPNLTVNGFYPALKKHHYYSGMMDGAYYLGLHADHKPIAGTASADRDYDPTLPLIVDVDPGSKINYFVVKQIVEAKREMRTLKEFWRKYPVIIQHIFDNELLPYYAGHKHKVLRLFTGRDANIRQPNSTQTVVDQLVDIARRHGWRVEMMTLRAGITFHDEKYHIITRVLEESDPRLYKVRINKDNCRDLIIGLESAEAIDVGNGKVRKDKRSEARLATTPAEHATHGSDAWDLSTVYYAKVKMAATANEFRDVRVIG